MLTLTHFRLCPLSRSIRLVLGEHDYEFELVEERAWQWRPEFLAINPAGELPVLHIPAGALLCGSYAISEYLSDEIARRPPDRRAAQLFPGNIEARAEVRRLVDWFHGKLHREVTRELLVEKVYPRLTPGASGGPNLDALRAIRSNLRYHLRYVAFLVGQRKWLAGEELSFADLAAAAHLSTLDYVGEVPWEQHPAAKAWYARVKSRRSFRPLLADRIPGLGPPPHYDDLDF